MRNIDFSNPNLHGTRVDDESSYNKQDERMSTFFDLRAIVFLSLFWTDCM
jgi:hypothetical protein